MDDHQERPGAAYMRPSGGVNLTLTAVVNTLGVESLGTGSCRLLLSHVKRQSTTSSPALIITRKEEPAKFHA
jgi:hypothetical protein